MDTKERVLNCYRLFLPNDNFSMSDPANGKSHGLTSLEVAALVLDLEDEFKVEISDQAFAKITNIGSLIEYIEEQL